MVGALLREPYRREFSAPRPGRERRSEAIDLAGAGRDHAFDFVAAGLTPPVGCDPHLMTFAPDTFWRGETHRMCDRPGAVSRLLEELAGAGVSQAVIVSAVATPPPHRLSVPRLEIQHRLGEFLAAAESAALRDALELARLRFDSVYLICPAHNPVGVFDVGGAYDDASDRRQDLVGTDGARLRGRVPPVHRTGRRRQRRTSRPRHLPDLSMHRDTRIVHAGYRKTGEPGPFLAGPQFSSTFTSPGDPAAHALTYGRFHNPTWTAWEEALRSLEGGDVVAFASGMAAVSAVFGVTLRPGDVLVLAADCYYTIRRMAAAWLEAIGVQVRLVPTRDNAQLGALEGARLLWLETPTNPMLDVCDIRALADAARARGALVAVDNTTATPYLQQPLALGATFVVASDTKAMSGHSDLILGHVGTTDAQLADALRLWRTQHGAIPGPMEVWLAHRSLPTLPLRLTPPVRHGGGTGGVPRSPARRGGRLLSWPVDPSRPRRSRRARCRPSDRS